MATLNMKGPYSFTEENIDAYVSKSSIGNYALGYSIDSFYPQYIGRSDTNLNKRIKDHLDEGYLEFKFSCAEDAIDAYFKECENYHDFQPEYNEIHPDKPNGLDFLVCPVCGQ